MATVEGGGVSGQAGALRHGVAQPLVQHNVAPGTFEQLTGQPSQLVQAVLLCVVGFLAIYGIELLARIIVKKEEE